MELGGQPGVPQHGAFGHDTDGGFEDLGVVRLGDEVLESNWYTRFVHCCTPAVIVVDQTEARRPLLIHPLFQAVKPAPQCIFVGEAQLDDDLAGAAPPPDPDGCLEQAVEDIDGAIGEL